MKAKVKLSSFWWRVSSSSSTMRTRTVADKSLASWWMAVKMRPSTLLARHFLSIKMNFKCPFSTRRAYFHHVQWPSRQTVNVKKLLSVSGKWPVDADGYNTRSSDQVKLFQVGAQNSFVNCVCAREKSIRFLAEMASSDRLVCALSKNKQTTSRGDESLLFQMPTIPRSALWLGSRVG